MKKLLAILLALGLVLVSVAAMAEDAKIVPTEELTFEITKTYTVNGTTNAVNPADTLKFTVAQGAGEKTVTGASAYPSADPTIADVTVATGAEEAAITVQLPTYTEPGIYYYTINETDTNVAGVTYTDPMYLKVTVIQDTTSTTEKKLVVAGIAIRMDDPDEGTKIDEFENIYNAGSLSVSKQVTGNAGDYDRVWNFTVTFTAPTGDKVVGAITATASGATAPASVTGGWTETATSTFKLKHGQSVTFNNIPAGVKYEVVETEANQDDYTTTPTGNTGTIAAKTTSEAKFVNNKTVEIDTGVALDTLPYVLLIALAVVSLVVLKARKREN